LQIELAQRSVRHLIAPEGLYLFADAHFVYITPQGTLVGHNTKRVSPFPS